MRFIIVLCCFLLVVAYADADPIEEPMKAMLLYAPEGDVKSEYGESIQLESGLGCVLCQCMEICLAHGFRPPFAAQCINANTCRCNQY